jgi:uncharacterized protein
MGTFVIQTANNNKVYFNLKASNGEVILTSQMYETRQGAQTGIDSVIVNAPIEARYEKKMSTRGKAYFVLKAANHEVIRTSEEYENTSNRDKGMEAVKSNAAGATVHDLSEAIK